MKIVEYSKELAEAFRQETLESLQSDYLVGLLEDQAARYVEGCRAEFRVLCIDGKPLPFTLSDGRGFFNDPVDALLDRTVEVLSESIESRWRLLGFSILISSVQWIWNALFHRKLIVLNNWLSHDYSFFDLTERELEAVLAYVAERYPGYVVFLSSTGRAGSFDRRLGFRRIYYTPEYFFDPHAGKRRRMLRNNLKYLDRTEYVFRFLGSGEPEPVYERLNELYDYLYVEKYDHSMLYTARWFRLNVESGLGRIFVFEKDGRIDMFGMFYEQDEQLLGGVMGYDMSLDHRELKFVPLVTSVYFKQSIQLDRTLNAGANNDDFKLQRGCYVGNVLCVRGFGESLGYLRKKLFYAIFSLLGSVGWNLNARYLEGDG